jgi:hypothetical protein
MHKGKTFRLLLKMFLRFIQRCYLSPAIFVLHRSKAGGLLDKLTRSIAMTDQIQISIDRDVYDRLQMLMVPPISDANAVIKGLLYFEGHDSVSAAGMEASEKHFTMTQELERSLEGVYDCGGAT